MCVALPGKVIDIEGTTASVEFDGNVVRANIGLVNVNIGDYVLVHAGMVIQTMKSDEALDMIQLFKDLEETIND